MIDSLKMDGLSDNNVEQITGRNSLSPASPLDNLDRGQNTSEFKPTIPDDNDEVGVSQVVGTNRFEARIGLEPTKDLEGWYDVSKFALTVIPSELCPTGNSKYELEGGQMDQEYIPRERTLSGKLNIISGDSTKIMNVYATWQAFEEREKIQFIEGTFGIERDISNPEFDYRINGTMTSVGDNYVLVLQGEKLDKRTP